MASMACAAAGKGRKVRKGKRSAVSHRAPAGTAAVPNMSVGAERFMLSGNRKLAAGSHSIPGVYYSPFTQYMRASPGASWMSMADFMERFRAGQKHKGRAEV